MAGKKKVKGKKLAGNYGSAYQGPKKIVREGTGQSGRVNIPRRDYPGFKMIETPDSTGMIKAYRGGKCYSDGIIRYPVTADVDPVRAAECQALMDYNSTVNSEGGPCHRADMARIYGEAYLREFERLARLRMGQSGPGAWRRK